MRDGFFAALAAAGLLLATAAPAAAVGIRHPFCIQGDEYPALSNCSFDTYAQCQASASGRRLSCTANPYFAGVSRDPRATPYPYPQPRRHARPPAPNPYAPFPNPFVFEED
jgi:hypothetical protein